MAAEKTDRESLENNGTVQVDGQELLRFVRARMYIVIVVALVAEATIALGTYLASSSYQAEAFIRMGTIYDPEIRKMSSLEGLALANAEATFQSNKVSFYPRPSGAVLITARANTRDDAISLAKKVTDTLIAYNMEIIDRVTARTRRQIELLQSQLKNINDTIVELNSKLAEKVGSEEGIRQVSLQARILNFQARRDHINFRLMALEERLLSDVVPPQVLKKPGVVVEQVRPHWTRNLVLGGFFGLSFGCFVVALLGMFRQAGVRADS